MKGLEQEGERTRTVEAESDGDIDSRHFPEDLMSLTTGEMSPLAEDCIPWLFLFTFYPQRIDRIRERLT